MAQATTSTTTKLNPFTSMTMREIEAVYTALQGAHDAIQGVFNSPSTTADGPAAAHWLEDEMDRISGVVEDQIIPLVRAFQANVDEKRRLEVLCHFAARVDDHDLDLEIANALQRYRSKDHASAGGPDRGTAGGVLVKEVSPVPGGAFNREATETEATTAQRLCRLVGIAVASLEANLPHNDPIVSDVIALGEAVDLAEEKIQNVVLALHG